jgi:hypothetical protein
MEKKTDQHAEWVKHGYFIAIIFAFVLAGVLYGTRELFLNQNISSSLRSDVIQNTPPTANAGADQTVPANTQVTLDASDSLDSDGEIVKFEWTQSDANPEQFQFDANSMAISILPQTLGTYSFTVNVTDDKNESAQDGVFVTVASVEPNNVVPIARLNADKLSIISGDEVTLDATESFHADQYRWRYLGGIPENDPTVSVNTNFTAENKQTLTLTTPGSHGFEVRVKNDSNEESIAQIYIQVSGSLNQLSIPVVHISNSDGKDEIVTGQTVVIDASASYDPDGEISKYEILVAGPARITLESGDSSSIKTFATTTAGDYTATINLTDSNNGISSTRIPFRVYGFGECLPSQKPCDLKKLSEALEAFGSSY